MNNQQQKENGGLKAMLQQILVERERRDPSHWDRSGIKRYKPGQAVKAPEGMPLELVRQVVERELEQERTTIRVRNFIYGYPMDVLNALVNVLHNEFGSVTAQKGGFFSSPLTMIKVSTGPRVDEWIQVPWGRLSFAGLSDNEEIFVSAEVDNGKPCLVLHGRVKRMNEKTIATIAEMTQDYVRKNSIFYGKAVELNSLAWARGEERFDPEESMPTFIQDPGLTMDDIILNDEELAGLQPVITRIKKSMAMKEAGISLSTQLLMSGDFGVGKSLFAKVLTSMCIEHGWTFVTAKAEDIEQALQLVRLLDVRSDEGRGVVLFVEDVDAAFEGSKRDAAVNRVLNIVSGATDRMEEGATILAMSTNHHERIPQAFRRAGRIDDFVVFRPPQGETILEFVEMYGNANGYSVDMEAGGEHSWEEVIELLNGVAPAFIKKVCRGALIWAVNNDESSLTVDHVYNSALSAQPHIKMAKGDVEDPDQESIDNLFGGIVEDVVSGYMVKVLSNIADVENSVIDVYNLTNDVDNQTRQIADYLEK